MIAYAPCHFNIKYRSSILYGTIHLADFVKLSQFLPSKFQGVVNDTIQRNGFFGHPENVLLALLNDENEKIRRKAWGKVLQARQACSETVRDFRIPKFNFGCDNYLSLIDLDDRQLKYASPLILNDIEVRFDNVKQLAEKKLEDFELNFNLKKIPCHAQAVERCVRVVKEAAMAVTDEKKRLGWILSTLQSRNIMPQF